MLTCLHLTAGDFDTAAMKSMVEQYLGPWSVAEGQPPAAPAIPNPPVPPQTTAGTVRARQHPARNCLTLVTVDLLQRLAQGVKPHSMLSEGVYGVDYSIRTHDTQF